MRAIICPVKSEAIPRLRVGCPCTNAVSGPATAQCTDQPDRDQVLRGTHLQRLGVPQHPGELETGHHTIRYMSARNGKLYRLKMHKDGEVVEVEGRHQLAVNNSNAGVVAGLSGLGVLFTLSFLVQNHISRGALEPLFTGWCTEAKPIYVVYPPNRHLSNKVRVFVDWVAELFAKHDLIQRKSSLPAEMCSGWATVKQPFAGVSGQAGTAATTERSEIAESV